MYKITYKGAIKLTHRKPMSAIVHAIEPTEIYAPLHPTSSSLAACINTSHKRMHAH